MPDEQQNPITKHLLNLVQGRQQTEVAKLALLTQIASSCEQVKELLETMKTELHELLEREQKR